MTPHGGIMGVSWAHRGPIMGAALQEDFMTTVVSSDQSELTTLSWGAVIAGAVAAAALSLFLLVLGVGIGFSVISPWSDQGVSATTFHIGAGLYLVAVAMLSS